MAEDTANNAFFVAVNGPSWHLVKISMESDWGKSVNTLIYSTPFGKLFTSDSRQRKHVERRKQGFYVSVSLTHSHLVKM